MNTSPTRLSWNLITRNIERDEFLEKKIHHNIARLEKHLQGFPPDSVHLQVALERNPKKDCFTARLTLRVPSNILHSEKTTDDLIKSLNLAVDSLLHDLAAFKAVLTGQRYWKRQAGRDQSHFLKSAAFALQAQAAGTGPQTSQDVVRDLSQQHYRELLRHAQRDIRHEEEAGELPPGALQAHELVDEIGRRVLAEADERPSGMGWKVWFHHLVHEELKRRRYLLRGQRAEPAPAPAPAPGQQTAAQAAAPGSRAAEPDPLEEIVTQESTLELLQHDLRSWPRQEREVFELYYVEGLDPEEIAMVTSYPLNTVQETLASVQQKLRERFHQQKAAA